MGTLPSSTRNMGNNTVITSYEDRGLPDSCSFQDVCEYQNQHFTVYQLYISFKNDNSAYFFLLSPKLVVSILLWKPWFGLLGSVEVPQCEFPWVMHDFSLRPINSWSAGFRARGSHSWGSLLRGVVDLSSRTRNRAWVPLNCKADS